MAGSAGRWRAIAGAARREWFILALAGTVALATAAPCSGRAADAVGWLGIAAISSLFFLQGARLSRDAIVGGLTHWRLHVAIGSATFFLLPLLGLLVTGEAGLTGSLRVGVLFLCVLPSTVQSSIALTSIAGGNVAGAVCAASASNIAGMILTPLLMGALLRLEGHGFNFGGIGKIVLELFVPLAIGHLLRPRIGRWVERYSGVLAVTDRSSILLVVYAAFSAAATSGIWQRLPLPALVAVFLADAAVLAMALALTTWGSRLAGMKRCDEVTVVFCGSQKSLVAGVPIANVLFGTSAAGVLLLPIMIYHPLQLLVCAGLARRYAARIAMEASCANLGATCADFSKRASGLPATNLDLGRHAAAGYPASRRP